MRLSGAQRRAVERAVQVTKHDGGSEVSDFLLARWSGTHVRQISTTPVPLAGLMAELTDIAGRTSHPIPDAVRTVLDPACGVGSLLLAVAHRWGPSTHLRLLGQDSDPVLADLAAARLMLAG